MATKDLPINAGQDGIPQPLSKSFDQTGNSSGFIRQSMIRMWCTRYGSSATMRANPSTLQMCFVLFPCHAKFSKRTSRDS